MHPKLNGAVYTNDYMLRCVLQMLKIEYMDKRSIILYRERADALMARRRADVGDMADEAAGGLFFKTNSCYYLMTGNIKRSHFRAFRSCCRWGKYHDPKNAGGSKTAQG